MTTTRSRSRACQSSRVKTGLTPSAPPRSRRLPSPFAYQSEVMTLARVLACPRHHGLTLNDLAHASGLDQPFVARLLAELCAG